MSVLDAQTAQGMATRHIKSVKPVVAGMEKVNVLLGKMMKRIKYGGYGTHSIWHVRKNFEEAQWVSGQLASRSFEEKDPVDEATLPFCFIDATYGVSEKSIKTNRAAGNMQIYNIQKENAMIAQQSLYRAWASAIFSNGTNTLKPVGLAGVVGDCYETTNAPTVAATKAYAGITLTTNGVSAYSANYSTMGWDNEYWYPICESIDGLPGMLDSADQWSEGAIYALTWIEQMMTYSSDASGTGDTLRPDTAVMAEDPYVSLLNQLSKSQKTYNVPLGSKDPVLANFPHVYVGNLACVRDDNTPDDSGSVERIFVFDSNAFFIHTLNKKSEGLIEGEWKADDPEVVGGVGVYKSNAAIICKTPKAVGCIVGCND